MSTSAIHIIDTSCLTQAFRVYYPFDIAPSFWNFLKHAFANGNLVMTNKVCDEIERGNDLLTTWLKTEVPSNLHLDCHANANIMANYAAIMNWGNAHTQYLPNAKRIFSEFDNADPFIVAAAIEKTALVVSQEVSAPNAKNNIKLPDVCNQFAVSHIDTFSMLRGFGFTM